MLHGEGTAPSAALAACCVWGTPRSVLLTQPCKEVPAQPRLLSGRQARISGMGRAGAGQTHGWVSGAVSTTLRRNTGCRTSERPSGTSVPTQSTRGGVCRGCLQVAVPHPAAVGRLTAMAVYLHATVHAEGGWPERSEALGQSRGSTRRRRTGQHRTDQ